MTSKAFCKTIKETGGNEYEYRNKRNPESSSKRKKFSEDAWKSVAEELEEGCGTVGIHLDVSHDAPTPLGMTVTCESELIAIDGRKLTFRVEAKDERGTIGKGVHERFIVNDEKFQAKANQK